MCRETLLCCYQAGGSHAEEFPCVKEDYKREILLGAERVQGGAAGPCASAVASSCSPQYKCVPQNAAGTGLHVRFLLIDHCRRKPCDGLLQ